MITITGPKAISIPPSAGGNPAMWDLVMLATSRGLKVQDIGNGQVKIAGITDREFLPVETVRGLVATGCEVDGYLVYFELSPEQMSEPVAESFPNRLYTEFADAEDPDSGVEMIHTWATWGRGGGESWDASEIDGKFYRSNQDGATVGGKLPASLWINAGLTIVASLPTIEAEL